MKSRALKLCIFYCSNHLEASAFAALGRGNREDAIKTISLPCSGKVDIPYLIKAFETGAEGVAIVTCKKDECRHFEGNLRAHKRAQGVEALLEEIGETPGRMAVFECGDQEAEAVLAEVKQFIGRVRGLPQMHARMTSANTQESTIA